MSQLLVIDKLREVLGNDMRTSEALGVGDNYPLRWRREGFIPEAHALAVEELHVFHNGEMITAYDVLLEARDARARRIREAELQIQEAL